MRSYQQLFAELKRRKVFRVAAVYGAVAFALIQVADPLVGALSLPAEFLTYIVVLLLLGFPVAMVLAWAFEVTPDGMHKTGDAAPGEIEAIVSLPASKRWPAGLMALAGVGALLAGAWWVGRQSAPASADSAADSAVSDVRLAFTELEDDPRPSLAVLPFADMSPEGDQEYFSDGITEEIINTLVGVSDLRVAARTSAFAFKGRQIDMRVVGDSLGVSYLIEGSVRKAGDRLRITAQLIDAADGTHLWSDQYDRSMDDVFAIQTEIAEAIAGELRVPLGLADARELVTPTADFEAYDLYLSGLAQMRTRGAAVAEAARLFEAAIARDSTWAPAWAKLAEASEILIWYPEAWDDPPVGRQAYREASKTVIPALLERAEQSARKALALDPGNASAYVALGSVMRDWRRWGEAEAAYRQALALDPDNAEAHHQYGEFFEGTGREAESLSSYGRSVALDPAPVRRGLYGFSLNMNLRPDEGIPLLRQAYTDSDSLPIIGGWLVRALETTGEFEEAALVRIHGGEDPAEVQARTRALAARDVDLLSSEARAGLTAVDWMMLGEPDSAVADLVAELVPFEYELMGGIYTFDPRLDPIRDTPEMRESMRRLGLAGVEVDRASAPADVVDSRP